MRLAPARAAPPADRFVEAEATLSALMNRLQSEETARMSHSDLETLLEQQGRELMRQLLQAHLDWRAQATPTTPVVGADGVERTHQRAGTRALETLLGTVQVTRDGHGARGRETLFPLDAALNLTPERYSFGIRRRAAEEATKGAYGEVVKILGTHASAAVAKRQVEAVVRRAAQDFDSYYLGRRLAWPTETGPSSKMLVLTFDGKGVPMRPADLRPATQAAASQRNAQADDAVDQRREAARQAHRPGGRRLHDRPVRADRGGSHSGAASREGAAPAGPSPPRGETRVGEPREGAGGRH